MHFLVSVIIMILPNFVKIFILNLYRGNNVSYKSRIGFSFIKVSKLIMEDYAVIGNFNLIRNVSFVEMKKKSVIGKFNNINNVTNIHLAENAIIRSYNTISSDLKYNYTDSCFSLGENSILTTHHTVDAVSNVIILNNTIIAGGYTQIFTHSFDLNRERLQRVIQIGNNCYIGTNCIVLGNICDNVIVGAGSTVYKDLLDSGLWTSNKLEKIADIKNFCDRVDGLNKYVLDGKTYWFK